MLIMKDVKGRNENGIRMNNESNTHKKFDPATKHGN